MTELVGEIRLEIEEVDRSVMIVRIIAPSCTVEILGTVSMVGRVLRITEAHIQGATAGALGRDGLNAIGRTILVEADADELVIEGGSRTTGRSKGRIPRPIRFPR